VINRRELVCAAGTLVFARATRAFAAAATYDLIIKGGRVIDPSLRVNGILDVAVAGGRIAAGGPNIAGNAADIIDCRGKLVVPGFICIHTPTPPFKEGPAPCLPPRV